MEPTDLAFLKLLCGSLAAAATLLVGYFELRARGQESAQEDVTTARRSQTRAWYAAKWDTIRGSGILDLPGRVIRWLLRIEAWIASKRKPLYRNKFAQLLGLSWLLLGPIVTGFAYGLTGCFLVGCVMLHSFINKQSKLHNRQNKGCGLN